MVSASCFLLLVLLACTKEAYSAGSKRFNVLYEEGLSAYGAQQWSTATRLLQEATDQYTEEKQKLFSCVRKCRDEKTTDDSLFTASGKLAEMELQVVHVSYCVQKCRETTFAREGVPLETIDVFETKLVYDYLQFSLAQVSVGTCNAVAICCLKFIYLLNTVFQFVCFLVPLFLERQSERRLQTIHDLPLLQSKWQSSC